MQNIETVAVEKGLCQVGSEDVDGCPQRNSTRMMEMIFLQEL